MLIDLVEDQARIQMKLVDQKLVRSLAKNRVFVQTLLREMLDVPRNDRIGLPSERQRLIHGGRLCESRSRRFRPTSTELKASLLETLPSWHPGVDFFVARLVSISSPKHRRLLGGFPRSTAADKKPVLLPVATARHTRCGGQERMHPEPRHIRYFDSVSSSVLSYMPSACSACAKSSRIL